MTLDAVNVLPVPVAPRSTWKPLPAWKFATSCSMAFGWSPAGAYSLTSWNFAAIGGSGARDGTHQPRNCSRDLHRDGRLVVVRPSDHVASFTRQSFARP